MANDSHGQVARFQRRMLGLAVGAVAVVIVGLTLGPSAREMLSPPPPPPAAPPVRSFGFLSMLTGEAMVTDPAGRERIVRGTEAIEEGSDVKLSPDALADFRVGDSFRMTVGGGSELHIARARVEIDGRTEVDVELRSGEVAAQGKNSAAGTRITLRTAGSVLTSRDSEFVASLTAVGLAVSVLSGEIRTTDAKGNTQIVRPGERIEGPSNEPLRIVPFRKEEIEEALRWAPHLRRRLVDLQQPNQRPTESTRELHEKFLRLLIRRSADWFIEKEHLNCMPWATDPVLIGELSLTQSLLKVFLNELTARHEIREIEIDEDGMIFEWKIDPKTAVTKVFFKGSLVAVETGMRGPDDPPGPEIITCIIDMDLDSAITFVFDDNRWKASVLKIAFTVVDAREKRK